MKMNYEVYGKPHWIRVPNKDNELIKEIFDYADKKLGRNVITNIVIEEDIFSGKEEN